MLPIVTVQDDLNLLSSLNTWGYIEFETLCALSSVEEKFKCAEFSCLSRCTYHFIGKYNYKREYMVHQIYICSNLKSPFFVTPDFKNKIRYAPYVSFRRQTSHIATNKG